MIVKADSIMNYLSISITFHFFLSLFSLYILFNSHFLNKNYPLFTIVIYSRESTNSAKSIYHHKTLHHGSFKKYIHFFHLFIN